MIVLSDSIHLSVWQHNLNSREIDTEIDREIDRETTLLSLTRLQQPRKTGSVFVFVLNSFLHELRN